MNCKIKYVLVLVLILVGFLLSHMYKILSVNRFYALLEDSMLDKVEEIKSNLKHEGSIEMELISRGHLEETPIMIDPGSTYYSKREKDTIVNYGAKYEDGFGYTVSVNVKNNSKYNLNMLDEDHCFKTLKIGSSMIEDTYLTNLYGYRSDDIVFSETIYVHDKVKFNYRDRDIEFPVEITFSFNAYGDEESIYKIEIIPYEISPYEFEGYSEKLMNEIELIVGSNKNIDKYIRSTNILLD